MYSENALMFLIPVTRMSLVHFKPRCTNAIVETTIFFAPSLSRIGYTAIHQDC